MSRATAPPAARFDRAARLSLVFALLIMVTSAAQAAYRFSLPSDGWLSGQYPESDNFEYNGNLVGATSDLRPGDFVTGLEGQPLAAYDGQGTPSFWRAGNTVDYDIRRGEQRLQVAVPLVHWTPQALLRSYALVPTEAFVLMGTAVLIVVGFLAFYRRPGDAAARALLLFVAGLGAVGISDLVPDGFYTRLYPIADTTNAIFSYFIYGAFLLPSLLAFTLVFPRPKGLVRRHPLLAYAPFLVGALIFIVLLTYPNAWQVGWFGTLAMVIASFLSLAHSFVTMRDAVSRAQMLWAVGGLSLGLVFFILYFPSVFGWVSPQWGYWFAILGNLAIPVMGLGLAIAVLRYRLFDIEVIIRRTTAYAILTALLALVYFGSVVILQRLLTPLTGDSTPAVVLSTLLIAALFLPLRRRVQAVIDRRFFRKKYDAEKTLAAFAATVRNETDLDALTAELVRVIEETMQPEYVSMWVRPVAEEKAARTSAQ